MECELGRFGEIEQTLKAHNAKERGVYFVINYGGHEDAQITRINAQFMECDDLPLEELKEMGVDVFFEDQGIHSVSGDGELMLTILASFAQVESLSASENVKWSIRKKFRAVQTNRYSYPLWCNMR